MADNEDRSLIPLPDGSLANTAAGARRILSAMIGETLAIGQQRECEQLPSPQISTPARSLALRYAMPKRTLEEARASAREDRKLNYPRGLSQKGLTSKSSQETGDEEIYVDDLKAGDVVEVAGQKFKVLYVDEDGTVTLEDHTRYGVQTIEAGHVIYGELEPLPSKSKISSSPNPPQPQSFLHKTLLALHQRKQLTTKGKIVLGKLNRAAKLREEPKDAKR